MTNDTPLDMLQIKIERARDALPKETRHAIDSVDWRAVILSFREKKGYSFEQLEDLELETELLLCGLLNPVDFPKELEERLKMPKPQVDLLVSEMNELVFKKIKDELVRNTERQEIFIKREAPLPNPLPSGEEKGGGSIPPIHTILEQTPEISAPANQTINKDESKVLEKAGIDITGQKLSGSFQMPTRKTEYALPTFSKDKIIKTSKVDPYRMDPNE